MRERKVLQRELFSPPKQLKTKHHHNKNGKTNAGPHEKKIITLMAKVDRLLLQQAARINYSELLNDTGDVEVPCTATTRDSHGDDFDSPQLEIRPVDIGWQKRRQSASFAASDLAGQNLWSTSNVGTAAPILEPAFYRHPQQQSNEHLYVPQQFMQSSLPTHEFIQVSPGLYQHHGRAVMSCVHEPASSQLYFTAAPSAEQMQAHQQHQDQGLHGARGSAHAPAADEPPFHHHGPQYDQRHTVERSSMQPTYMLVPKQQYSAPIVMVPAAAVEDQPVFGGRLMTCRHEPDPMLGTRQFTSGIVRRKRHAGQKRMVKKN
jgi:hypothetical protein